MLATIKSEFRKLLTVRSTYFIIAASLAMVMLFAGFGEGFKGDASRLLESRNLLVSESTNAIMIVGLILAFAGMLLAGHEYRYNTITYTLTTSNRRYKVLLAKLLVISVFAVAASLFITFFSPLCTILGAQLGGKEVGPQAFDVWDVVWRCVLCGWGYAMYAFVLIMILRNQVGAIVTFLLFPLIGENVLAALVKNSGQYLPFTALQSMPASLNVDMPAHANAPLIVLAYVAGGLLVSWLLFSRRDAN